MTRMLAAVTYADLVPHNRVFGVGRGLFSRGPLSRGIALVCPDVPRTTSNPPLWREGMQVHGAGRTAYTIGKGRRGSARRMVYMINCVDPADTKLIVSGLSRRERRTLLNAALTYKRSNCKFVERRHKGRWVLAVQMTRSVVAGEQLILPCYLA